MLLETLTVLGFTCAFILILSYCPIPPSSDFEGYDRNMEDIAWDQMWDQLY